VAGQGPVLPITGPLRCGRPPYYHARLGRKNQTRIRVRERGVLACGSDSRAEFAALRAAAGTNTEQGMTDAHVNY